MEKIEASVHGHHLSKTPGLTACKVSLTILGHLCVLERKG